MEEGEGEGEGQTQQHSTRFIIQVSTVLYRSHICRCGSLVGAGCSEGDLGVC